MQSTGNAALVSKSIAFAMLFFFAVSVNAHHATATEYDVSKTVTLKGTITRLDWANPHIHVYMQVKDERGVTQEWDVEFPAPGAAIVAGLSKQTLANGVVLTFEGYASKPGFHPTSRPSASQDQHSPSAQYFACATGITLSTGEHVTFVVGI
jgi:hypothetical protein